MPTWHAVVVGEPRAGRADLILGLRRALDPRSWSRTPDLSDLYRSAAEPAAEAVTGDGRRGDAARPGRRPEQDLDDRLELIDPSTGLPAEEEQVADGVLGVRVRYRIYFDEVLADYDHA
jgi:putative ATP-dependent endonuclease of the OLD family